MACALGACVAEIVVEFHKGRRSPPTNHTADGSPLMNLPPEGIDLEKVVSDFERALILKALERTSGNRTEAARVLGVSFRSLRYRLSKLGITGSDGPDDPTPEGGN